MPVTPVTPDPVSASAGTALLTLSEYKMFQGVPSGDTENDPQISVLLSVASRAVRSYTGRQFEVAGATATPRSYQYQGDEILDIDDCVQITNLSTDVGIPGQSYDFTDDQFVAMPQDDSPVFYYVVIFGGFGLGSAEMGFTRNLDTIGLRPKSPLITVTARWGWDAIPDDVKYAAALTAGELLSSPRDGGGESLNAEAIEGWSRSWGSKVGTMQASMAVPNRARDILSGYQRLFV